MLLSFFMLMAATGCEHSSPVAAVQNRQWSAFLLLVIWLWPLHLESAFQSRVRPSASAQFGFDPSNLLQK